MNIYIRLNLAIAITICMVSFSQEWALPAGTAQAASNSLSEIIGHAEMKDTTRQPAQAVVALIAGMVFILFGLIAVFPVLNSDAEKLSQSINRTGN